MQQNKRCTFAANSIVTGAGSGIGRAYALELARREGNIVCADINFDTAHETADLINHFAGAKALAVSCDVSQLAAVQQLAIEARNWFNAPIDLVINNAGVGAGGQSIGHISITDWHWILNINLWGVIYGCHVFAPILKQQKHGALINVSSAAGYATFPGMAPYNTSKAAVMALTETLHSELKSADVYVSMVCPSFVATNIVKNGRIKGASAKFAERLMSYSFQSPASIVKQSLNAVEKNQLYVLPQWDSKLAWRLKRYLPNLYVKSISRFATR